jgi:arginine utilization protein RocB
MRNHSCCGEDKIQNLASNSLMFNALHSGMANDNIVEYFYKLSKEDSSEFLIRILKYYRDHNHLIGNNMTMKDINEYQIAVFEYYNNLNCARSEIEYSRELSKEK